MADPFVAEIRIFTGNFAPRGWALCNGQILPISQNTALFSLLGTTYGGDGKSNFGLPNFQGNVPMGFGQGPGLSQRDLGEIGGSPNVTLLDAQSAQHNHLIQAENDLAAFPSPNSTEILGNAGAIAQKFYGVPTVPPAAMASGALLPAGGGLPHNNMQPYLTLNFIIALQGVYPSRS